MNCCMARDGGVRGCRLHRRRATECQRRVEWHVATTPGKRRALRDTPAGRLCDRIEPLEAQVRVRGEHAFRVIKRQFGYVKVRYRGLTKNTAQPHSCLRWQYLD